MDPNTSTPQPAAAPAAAPTAAPKATHAAARALANGLGRSIAAAATHLRKYRKAWLVLGVLAATGAALALNPPLRHIEPGQVGLRENQATGHSDLVGAGWAAQLPLLHRIRLLPVQDQFYRPTQMQRADGPAPAQSVEGLSFGVDVTVRWAIDTQRLAQGGSLPAHPEADLVAPALHGVLYRHLARHGVREIYASRRTEIQQAMEAELRERLKADGLLLKGLQMGRIDLPAEYRRSMDTLLAEGLAAEKMRYTLELKDKRVKESELEAQADKVRRETAAEAAAREAVIAARAQEEAMKHVLPFKQRQVEQRQLEAEAQRAAQLKLADGNAQARRIEAQGEAEARQKLADAEAYRVARVGRAQAEQMAQEGALITRHPLLIQKTLADKLSDKVQVVIAPPPADGGFIGNTLLGMKTAKTRGAQAHDSEDTGTEEQ